MGQSRRYRVRPDGVRGDRPQRSLEHGPGRAVQIGDRPLPVWRPRPEDRDVGARGRQVREPLPIGVYIVGHDLNQGGIASRNLRQGIQGRAGRLDLRR